MTTARGEERAAVGISGVGEGDPDSGMEVLTDGEEVEVAVLAALVAAVRIADPPDVPKGVPGDKR